MDDETRLLRLIPRDRHEGREPLLETARREKIAAPPLAVRVHAQARLLA
jgi:hypothetical protein